MAKRYVLTDETGTGFPPCVAELLGPVKWGTSDALLMTLENSQFNWGGGEIIKQIVVIIINPPVTISDLKPGETEVVVWGLLPGEVVNPSGYINPSQSSPLLEGRMSLLDMAN